MHPLVNIAVRAARRAGDISIRHIDRLDELTVHAKHRNDFVTEVDRRAEREIIQTIRKAYPEHGVLAEESGADTADAEFVWIIDPLDGTTNFLHAFPIFAVSIAVQYRGRLEHGVIYDPMRQELFVASRGRGALLDGRRIRSSKRPSLDGALIATGFPARDPAILDHYLEMLRAVIGQAAGVRRPGAAALDLAYVAAGRLDGFFELGLNPWDVAAGALLIQEAGGIAGNVNGGTEFLQSGNILAGTPRVFAALARAFKPHLPPALRPGTGDRGPGTGGR
jgi:myo-inositol-1(or 4)-monophosphatase